MTREEAVAILSHKVSACLCGTEWGEALDMAIEALRAKGAVDELMKKFADSATEFYVKGYNVAKREIALSGEYERAYQRGKADATKWIPCSERLPNELEAVNVTWVNHNPPVYYQHIKDVPKADTAVYYKGAWYWWDATLIDLLGEYDGAYVHGIEPIDKDIEVIAWMPLPKPYKAESEGGK